MVARPLHYKDMCSICPLNICLESLDRKPNIQTSLWQKVAALNYDATYRLK